MSSEDASIKFFQMVPNAIAPMPADQSALGGMPAAAHQYCEALRSASSYGWYGFPGDDIAVRWDGSDVFIHDGEQWTVLSNLVDPALMGAWNSHCPPDMKDCAPPVVSSLFVPGVLQIWTGLLVSTQSPWHLHVRPLANLPVSRQYSCYEGIVQTDWFSPCPLFINIKLLDTQSVIKIPRTKPLFQLQLVHEQSYSKQRADTASIDQLTDEDWHGLSRTIRSVSPERPHDIGAYGTTVRKRRKQTATA